MAILRFSQFIAASTFSFALVVMCGCGSKSSPEQSLVGTWRYVSNSASVIRSDLTFTVATNGGYVANTTIPETHTLRGMAEIRGGFLILTVTNRDNTDVLPSIVERDTIIRLDEGEFVSQSEGSSVQNVFRKLQRTR